MDKGIIIGVEHEVAARPTLPFVLFRHSTSVRRVLNHLLHLKSEPTTLVTIIPTTRPSRTPSIQ